MADISKYIALVTSEHRNQPRYIQTISITLQALADITDLATNLYSYFDVDSAIGAQLNILGKWVGASRFLETPLENVYFSWDIAGIGWDQGSWKQPFDPTTGLVELQDAHYRTLIKAKIVANQWDGTIQNAYEAWNILFEPEGYHILIQDGTPAKASYLQWEPPTILEGFDYGGWEPGGVSNYKIAGGMSMLIALIAPYEPPLPPLTIFAWDNPQAGYDIGYWDVTPSPIAEPSIDSVTLALFRGGHLGMKPAGVSAEYATQSYRGMPMFAWDVPNDPIFSTAPPVFLAGWDRGAWAIITPGDNT
jgi:hypothetical protein